jgi:hypothetical protein
MVESISSSPCYQLELMDLELMGDYKLPQESSMQHQKLHFSIQHLISLA